MIVFLAPNKREQRFVKRVIGLPGDTVRVQGNEVYVNGRQLEHRPVSTPGLTLAPGGKDGAVDEYNGAITYRIQCASDASGTTDHPTTEVPQGHCFVLGDNRGLSFDSRRFGCVPLGDILGKAEYIYFPAKDWSRFGEIGTTCRQET